MSVGSFLHPERPEPPRSRTSGSPKRVLGWAGLDLTILRIASLFYENVPTFARPIDPVTRGDDPQLLRRRAPLLDQRRGIGRRGSAFAALSAPRAFSRAGHGAVYPPRRRAAQAHAEGLLARVLSEELSRPIPLRAHSRARPLAGRMLLALAESAAGRSGETPIWAGHISTPRAPPPPAPGEGAEPDGLMQAAPAAPDRSRRPILLSPVSSEAHASQFRNKLANHGGLLMSPWPQIQGPEDKRGISDNFGPLARGRCVSPPGSRAYKHVHGPSRGRRGADFLIDGGGTLRPWMQATKRERASGWSFIGIAGARTQSGHSRCKPRRFFWSGISILKSLFSSVGWRVFYSDDCVLWLGTEEMIGKNRGRSQRMGVGCWKPFLHACSKWVMAFRRIISRNREFTRQRGEFHYPTGRRFPRKDAVDQHHLSLAHGLGHGRTRVVHRGKRIEKACHRKILRPATISDGDSNRVYPAGGKRRLALSSVSLP